MALPRGVRNAERLPDGRIDCKINHPVHGWIPTTADADDPDTHRLHAAILASGESLPERSVGPALDRAQQVREELQARLRRQWLAEAFRSAEADELAAIDAAVAGATTPEALAALLDA